MVARIKLGELLVRAGVISEAKLRAALAEQKRWGGRLGKVLVEMNFVSEEVMARALSKQLAMPLAQLDQIEVPREILNRIDSDFAQLNSVCPERYIPARKTLVLAMADPINVNAIDEVARMTGLRVEATIAGENAIVRAIQQVYGTSATGGKPGERDQMMVLTHQGEERSMRPDFSSRAPEPTGAGYGAPYAPPMNGGAYGAPMPPNGYPSSAGPNGYPPVQPLAMSPMMQQPMMQQPMMQQPMMQQPMMQQPGRPPSPTEMALALEDAQRKQLRAIRAMVDLLIERGIFSREEYLARLNRR